MGGNLTVSSHDIVRTNIARVRAMAMIDGRAPRVAQICLSHSRGTCARWTLLAMAISAILTPTGTRANLMNLPDGIENVLGFVPRSSFQCQADGYFGDIDNDCRLFHLCQRQVAANGRVEWRHWTYACGNQTMFNQLTLTCAFVDEAIPCRHASQFQYLNEVIHKPAEPFLTDADVTSGFSYYSNRIMSDGARARAFHDSQLLSQIGGQQQQQFAAESPSAASLHNGVESEFDQANQQVAPASSFFNPKPQFQSQSARLQQQQQQQQQPALRLNFEFRETPGPAHPQTHRAAPSQNSQSNLIEEHAFQLQHQAASDAVAANNQQLQSLQNFGNFFLGSPQQPSQQPPVSSQTQNAPDSSPVDVASSSNRQQTFAVAAAPTVVGSSQQTGSGAQHSFEFSIATNHQAGASGEPANVLFNQAQAQAQAQQQQQQHPAPSQAQQFANADELRRQFAAQLPPVAEQLVAPTTTTTPATTTLATQTTAAATSEPSRSTSVPPPREISASTPVATPPPSSPLAPTFTSSQRFAQVAQPTAATSTLGPAPATTPTTATATAATTTTTTSSTTTTASTPTAEQRPTARRAQQQVSQTGRRAAGRAAERTRTAGFQSTRLSSQQKRQAADNSPIVMRKPVVASELSSGRGGSSSSSALLSLNEPQDSLTRASDWSAGGGDFWRRSFDAQLMAPKFESLLLRRRV